MKIRLFVYGSLLAITLALPCVYKVMESTIQKQEQLNRENTENWLGALVDIELNLARKANNRNMFQYHYNRAVNYFLVYLLMVQQDLNNLKVSLGAIGKII